LEISVFPRFFHVLILRLIPPKNPVWGNFGGIFRIFSIFVRLLYFVTKNHSFFDGNKRIAATIFLYFLDCNGIFYNDDGKKLLDDHTLVALTIMIAESRPEVFSLVLGFTTKYNEITML